jgi:hypothetical protein
MSDPKAGGSRRIDRVLDPSYAKNLSSLSLDALRDRRREAEQEEVDLSYLRRLLHARIDIVRAEQAGRSGEAQPQTLLARLPEVLAETGGGQPYGLGKHHTVEPSRAGASRRRVERLVGDIDLSDVRARSDAELAGALRSYTAEERRVSDLRVRVQRVVDTCAEELARRYADGSARVDDLLGRETGGAAR